MNATMEVLRWLKSDTCQLRIVNPLTAGAAYIRVCIFISTLSTTFLNMLKIKYDINQQDLKRVDLNFVKSE